MSLSLLKQWERDARLFWAKTKNLLKLELQEVFLLPFRSCLGSARKHACLWGAYKPNPPQIVSTMAGDFGWREAAILPKDRWKVYFRMSGGREKDI